MKHRLTTLSNSHIFSIFFIFEKERFCCKKQAAEPNVQKIWCCLGLILRREKCHTLCRIQKIGAIHSLNKE